jgi:hypothetical protein
MEKIEKPTTSHASIIGIFIVLVLFLSVPLVIFSAQQSQDFRQKAAPILPTPDILQAQNGNGYISGYIYLDQNEDGERNYSEKAAGGVQIKITQVNINAGDKNQTSSLITTQTTDENGYFKYQLPESFTQTYSLVIQLILPNGYKTINTNPLLLLNIKNDAKEITEFGIYPIKPVLYIPSSSPVHYKGYN